MASYDHDTPLSLAHLSELEVPPAALADMAAAAGFASIGVRALPAMPGGLCYPLHEPGPRAALRRALDEAGIGLLCIELIPLDRMTDPAAFRPAIEAGAELGARRVSVAGDDPDPGIVAQKMAALCDVAAPLGMAVDIEFMPFRPVAGLADALEVVARARRPNAHVLVDALHVFRSHSDLALLARAPSATIGGFQLCDAAAVAPEGRVALAEEARTRRLLPGDGALDLRALIAALPVAAPLAIEVPLAGRFPSMQPAARLAALARATRIYLGRAVARPDNEE